MLSFRLITGFLSLLACITSSNAATYSNPLRNPDGSDVSNFFERSVFPFVKSIERVSQVKIM
jgi:hypothetical protein